MLAIDLNADLGEGMADDEALMPFLSSVNIACGGHAGDNASMLKTVLAAKKNNLAIGAHPSFPDKKNFGRNDMIEGGLDPEELSASLTIQIRQLQKVCRSTGADLHHVKPHGALYNRACVDYALATLLCSIIIDIDPELFFYGLGGTKMEKAAADSGLRFVPEAFADRVYLANGLLKPRTVANALIEDPAMAVKQVLQLVETGTIRADTGEIFITKAESVCIHSDSKHALAMAMEIHDALSAKGIKIIPKLT
jgi:UPF0271 protein